MPKALLKTTSSSEPIETINRLCHKLYHRLANCQFNYKPNGLRKTDSVTSQSKLYYSLKLKIEIRDSVTVSFAALYFEGLKFC